MLYAFRDKDPWMRRHVLHPVLGNLSAILHHMFYSIVYKATIHRDQPQDVCVASIHCWKWPQR